MTTTTRDLICWHCGSTEAVGEYLNPADFDPLRDAEPPTIALCMSCLLNPYVTEPAMSEAEIAWRDEQNRVAAAAEMALAAEELVKMARRDAELEQWHRSRQAAGLSPWP